MGSKLKKNCWAPKCTNYLSVVRLCTPNVSLLHYTNFVKDTQTAKSKTHISKFFQARKELMLLAYKLGGPKPLTCLQIQTPPLLFLVYFYSHFVRLDFLPCI